MTNEDQPERYRGNLKHPLVRMAAMCQVRVRNDLGERRREISELITECQHLHARDELLTAHITLSSDPEEARREAALDQLDRLFNRDPDGMLPAQEPFQEPDEPEPHPAVAVLRDLLDLVDTGDPSPAAVEHRINRAIEIINGVEQ